MPKDAASAKDTRFRSSYSLGELGDEVIPGICALARPSRPQATTGPEYDGAIPGSPWPDSPTEAGLRKRTRLPFRRIIEIVHSPELSLARTVEANRRRRPTAPPDEEEIRWAIRVVLAGLLPQDPAFYSAETYQRRRSQLIATSRRRHRHAAPLDRLLPDRHEIENALRDPKATTSAWHRALMTAGYAIPTDADHPRMQSNDPVLVAGWFYDELGCLPWEYGALNAFARGIGESLNWPYESKTIGPVNDALRKQRAAAGQTLPKKPLPRGKRPSLDGLAPRENPVSPRAYEWTTEKVLDGLELAWIIVGPTSELQQTRQRELATEYRNQIPHPSAVDKYAKLEGTTAKAFREKARKRAKRRMKAATDAQ